MAFAAARVAGTTIFLTVTFERPATDNDRFRAEAAPVSAFDGPNVLLGLIEQEKRRAAISAAAA